MSVDILWRSVESRGGDPWTKVGEASSEDDANDELASWQGPRLSHGDIVVIRGDGLTVKSAFVFDGTREAFAWADKVFISWERDLGESPMKRIDIARIFTAGRRFDDPMVRRAVLAACACARIALRVAGGQPLCKKRLAEAERWAIDGSRDDVRRMRLGANELQSRTRSTVAMACGDALSAACCGASGEIVTAMTDAAGAVGRSLIVTRDPAPLHAAILRAIPLSVLLCARAGVDDPLPLEVIDVEDL